MAERVLPDRERAAEILAQRGIQRVDGDNVLEAYAKGELQTEAERREAIDYQAAYQWASENFVPQKFVDQCLAAALPDLEV